MKPLLIVEIVSALVALVALVWLVWYLVQRRTGRADGAVVRRSVAHVRVAMVLCVAAVVHGASAMAYASGAPAAAYALGWAGLACFALSGACMAAPVRGCLKDPMRWHVALFVGGLVLVVAHTVAGRL